MQILTKARSKAGKSKTKQGAMPAASETRYELPPLVFSQPVKDRSEDILSLLNRTVSPEAVELENQTAKWSSLLAPFTKREVKSYSGLYGAATKDLYGSATKTAVPVEVKKRKTLSDCLRVLVDEWLDSGAHSSGSETASDRNFENSPAVSLALYSFSKSGHLMLLPYGNAPSLWLEEKHMQYVGRKHDPRFDYVQPLDLTFDEIAQVEMTFILLSDLRWRLSKCRKCGVYFLLKHLKRTYSGGAKCESCSHRSRQDNQFQATADARARAKGVLHALAARKFRKQISGVAVWHNDKALKSEIADYLNAEIKRSDFLQAVYREPLTGKWTAQPQIDKRSKRPSKPHQMLHRNRNQSKK
jgi:hypothetical protein